MPPLPNPATLAAHNPAQNPDTISQQRFCASDIVSCRCQPGGRFRGTERRKPLFHSRAECVKAMPLMAQHRCRCVRRELAHAAVKHRMERSALRPNRDLALPSTKGAEQIRRETGRLLRSPATKPARGPREGLSSTAEGARTCTPGIGGLRVDRRSGSKAYRSVENLKEPTVMAGDATDGTQGALARDRHVKGHTTGAATLRVKGDFTLDRRHQGRDPNRSTVAEVRADAAPGAGVGIDAVGQGPCTTP